MQRLISILLVLLLVPAAQVAGQGISSSLAGPPTYGPLRVPTEFEILGISVEGVEAETMRNFVLRNSGLTVGQTITLPGDQAISEAIRNIYQLRVFSDVKILEEQRAGSGVFLVIRVKEEPQLSTYTFTGVKKKHIRDLEKELPLYKGSRVRPADMERSVQVIKDYFAKKGHMLAEVVVDTKPGPANTVELEFAVEIGEKVRIREVRVSGNEEITAGTIRRKMKKTKARSGWNFWRSAKFDRLLYEQDKANVVSHLNNKGFYDARVVTDSVWMDTTGEKPGLIVELNLQEGPRYHIRNIDWEGNTVYSDQVLSASLGVETGDAYNAKRLEQNLLSNQQSSDVSSLYMNRGYMLFRVQPEVRVIEGDSLDLFYDIYEGDIFHIGEVSITGNEKTKEHVIRRELYTVPGQTFSRELIQETIRRLSQLSYFDQEKLGAGPNIDLDQENKKANLSYNFEEVGSDQLELSGTYGRFGLILMLRFAFNNFLNSGHF